MRLNTRAIVIVLVAVAALLAIALLVRGEGGGMMRRLGTAIHGR